MVIGKTRASFYAGLEVGIPLLMSPDIFLLNNWKSERKLNAMLFCYTYVYLAYQSNPRHVLYSTPWPNHFFF